MVKVCRNIYYFHDKKRRLEYGRIKRLLGLDDDERSNVTNKLLFKSLQCIKKYNHQ